MYNRYLFVTVRGEVLTFNNNNNNPDDDRSYLVDFEMKSWQQDTDSDRNRDKYTPTLLSEDMRVEQERRNWEDEQKRGRLTEREEQRRTENEKERRGRCCTGGERQGECKGGTRSSKLGE